MKKRELSRLKGKKIISIKRRSKYLLFSFNNNLSLIIHLGMTGKFFFINKKNIKEKTSFYYSLKSKLDKHDHVTFVLNNKSKLIYNDVRKFGFMKISSSDNIERFSHFKNLGPEPFDKYFSFEYFKEYLVGKNRFVKDLLMDQKFISGLGNIYVNEILFYSRISPLRKVFKLKDNEIKKLIKSTRSILSKAISHGGSSIKDFAYDNDKLGSFQQKFNVYGKSGQQCSNADCNQKIIKIKMFNRSSFFCKKCQK